MAAVTLVKKLRMNAPCPTCGADWKPINAAHAILTHKPDCATMLQEIREMAEHETV